MIYRKQQLEGTKRRTTCVSSVRRELDAWRRHGERCRDNSKLSLCRTGFSRCKIKKKRSNDVGNGGFCFIVFLYMYFFFFFSILYFKKKIILRCSEIERGTKVSTQGAFLVKSCNYRQNFTKKKQGEKKTHF